MKGAAALAGTGGTVGDAAAKETDQAHENDLEARLLPFPSEFEFKLQDTTDPHELAESVDSEIAALDGLQWQWNPAAATGLGIATNGDCWSRKARRRKEHDSKQNKPRADDEAEMRDEEQDEDPEPAFVFRIQIRISRSHTSEKRHEDSRVVVMVRWLRGHDHVLFESFCGWLKRKLLVRA